MLNSRIHLNFLSAKSLRNLNETSAQRDQRDRTNPPRKQSNLLFSSHHHQNTPDFRFKRVNKKLVNNFFIYSIAFTSYGHFIN